MKDLLMVVMLVLIASSASADADEVTDFRYLQAIAEARYHRLDPAGLDQRYHIYVRLPAGYPGSGDALYPTVYLLDGGNMFPLVSGLYR